MGLWYLKDTGMSLTAYVDADHAVYQDTRRSTSGSAQFLGMRSMSPETLKRLTEEEDEIISSKAQQIKLDNALVAPKNRHVIGKCNMRINPGKKPKEPTYQVVLDALALTTCYHAFLITAKVHGQEFDEPPTEEEALSFILKLGYSREIKYITDVIVDHLHQPWRTFASIINKYLCGKIDNMDFKKQDNMFYPRFTKIIIHHFLEKDKSISMRNKMFMHIARDDSLLGTMRFVSRHASTQVYGAIIPKAMTNQALLESVGYKTYYAITSGAEPPKSRKSQKKSDSTISSEEYPSNKKSAKLRKLLLPNLNRLRRRHRLRLTEARTFVTDEGTGTKLGVPDVPKYDSENEKVSWGDSGEEDDDDENDSEDENNDDGYDDNDSNDGDGDDDDDANDDNQEVDDTNDDDEETDNDRTELDIIKIHVLNQSSTEYYEEEEEKIIDEETMDEEEDE
ncbi:hypothetical protein Tco_0749401 [Tanacetum coccineum]|uniref:Uncharacterized protein n=1 Tax=Tanacetum coccineum TaxID=301880 RepID=A0ABQ4YYJ8_9ASTR